MFCRELVENHTNKILDEWSKIIKQPISTWEQLQAKVENSERNKERTHKNLFTQFGPILT